PEIDTNYNCPYHFTKSFFPICHNGLGIHSEKYSIAQLSAGRGPNYSLVEVFAGKGPCMAVWAAFATNQMEISLITVYVFVILVIYLIDIKFEFKNLKTRTLN
ncbi:MAG: hypothetical protein JRJ00_09965, partial [Deltaproteobacteria bacterium]|nr:hypothetical protein [Deltaproteobacteria bacterium]